MIQHPFFAFGMPHGSEWLWIFLAIIVLFGAEKLPKLARGLGKSLGEFKKAKEDFEKEVRAAETDQPAKKPEEQNLISGNVPKTVTPTPATTATPVTTTTSADELTKKS